MRINFNSFHLGCNGGNRFIFELSNGLVDRGHKVTITHAGLPSLHDWFSPIKAEIIECNIGLASRFLNKYGLRKINIHKNQEKNLIKKIPDCDLNIATYYTTANSTLKSKKGMAGYLVQHFESHFFSPESNESKEAELTYSLPMLKFCVSEWLTKKVNGYFIGNGVNLSRFKLLHSSRQYDVMVISKTNIKWKGNYGPIVVALRNAGLKVLEVQNFTDAQLVESYNKSNVLLYLSEQEGFGYPPLEAMACGCAVISTPCCEYLIDNQNCAIIQNSSVVGLTKYIATHSSERYRLIEGGLKTAKEFDFSKTVDRFETIVKLKVNEDPIFGFHEGVL